MNIQLDLFTKVCEKCNYIMCTEAQDCSCCSNCPYGCSSPCPRSLNKKDLEKCVL